MPMTPVDYDPFAPDYGNEDQFTRPTPGLSPRQPAQMASEPPPFDEPMMRASQARMQADPGVRTARGLVRRGEEATQDRLFQDLRQRFIGNPQALSMLKYLEAQQKYGDQTLKTLKAAQLRPAQPMDTLPPDDPSSVARPGEYERAQMPAQRIQPPSAGYRPGELQTRSQEPLQRIQDPSSVARPGELQAMGQGAARQARLPSVQPGSGIPRQQNYQSMRPRPGMVVNGYRLVNPAKPNDRASWQPVTEK
jgi:hypothetical protein